MPRSIPRTLVSLHESIRLFHRSRHLLSAALLVLPLAACHQADDKCRTITSCCVSSTAPSAIPRATHQKLTAALQRLDAPSYQFPWAGLEAHIAKQPGQRLLLVGYGSLLSKESAAETIADAGKQAFTPVIAAGAQRVFDYRIPPAVLKEMDSHAPARQGAALNVVATGRPGDIINGRLIAISIQDLPALRLREHGYHLRPVVCLPWGQANAKPFTAYVLAAEAPIVNGQQVIDPKLLPNPPYVKICYDGAKEVSPRFADLFLDTSYLANRKTTLRQWLKSQGELK